VEEGKLPEEEQKWAIYYSFPFRCNSLIGWGICQLRRVWGGAKLSGLGGHPRHSNVEQRSIAMPIWRGKGPFISGFS
jgi:hypothetical protein